jgi:hypothetical protein
MRELTAERRVDSSVLQIDSSNQRHVDFIIGLKSFTLSPVDVLAECGCVLNLDA